jgi:hypothetical protein
MPRPRSGLINGPRHRLPLLREHVEQPTSVTNPSGECLPRDGSLTRELPRADGCCTRESLDPFLFVRKREWHRQRAVAVSPHSISEKAGNNIRARGGHRKRQRCPGAGPTMKERTDNDGPGPVVSARPLVRRAYVRTSNASRRSVWMPVARTSSFVSRCPSARRIYVPGSPASRALAPRSRCRAVAPARI